MKKTIFVTIEKEIEVIVDESKFDEKFMGEFRDYFYKFHTLDEHIEHLAQMKARGLVDNWSSDPDGVFIEGYGGVKTMGIELKEISEDWIIGEHGIL